MTDTPDTSAAAVERLITECEALIHPGYDDTAGVSTRTGHHRRVVATLGALLAERDKAVRARSFCEQWYAERIARLADLGKERGCWPEMAAILANGRASSAEPPSYGLQLQLAIHRAERAEAERDVVRAGWLLTVQHDNQCHATGEPCRKAERCGCALEIAALAMEGAAVLRRREARP